MEDFMATTLNPKQVILFEELFMSHEEFQAIS
jgi:hypothetical protein